ncbi:MAG: septum formation initiator family protein [Candidatus Paceibacterota bacterium]|jgi:cell division protein FtsB
MRNFQEKSSWRHIVESKPFLILFSIIILFFAWNVFSFLNKMLDTSKNMKIAEEKVATLKQQKENISNEINSLNTDEGKEKFFRENLGLVKDGEGLTVVVEDKNPPTTPKPESSGFWSFLTSWFK